MPRPMINDEHSSIGNDAELTKSSEPTSGSVNPAASTVFWLKRSMSRPAGMLMMPYARKNDMGMKPASARCDSRKLSIISGMSGPMMFVINDITNQNTIIRPTIA